MALKERVEQRRLDTTVESLTRDRDRKLHEIERKLDGKIRNVQNVSKAMALFLPMLPPLAIGLAVFMHRRSLESEGVASSRKRLARDTIKRRMNVPGGNDPRSVRSAMTSIHPKEITHRPISA